MAAFNVSRPLNSIGVKVLIVLVVIFSIIAALVTYLLLTQSYPKIKEESNNTIEGTGQYAVSQISANIRNVDRIAHDLYGISTSMPLEDAYFEKGIEAALVDKVKPLLSIAAIWPDKHKFNPEIERNAFIYNLIDDQYKRVPLPDSVHYQDFPWYNNTKLLAQRRCAWGAALQSTLFAERMVISCQMRVDRDGQFFGPATVSMELGQFSKTIQDLQKTTGGYILLLDTANGIFASSDATKVPITKNIENSKTNRTLSTYPMADFLEKNPGFEPVNQIIAGWRQTEVDAATKILPANLQKRLFAYDELENYPKGSTILTFQAYNTDYNSYVSEVTNDHIATVSLAFDDVLNEKAEAYVFNVPETYWKLVIVKPESEVVAVADSLTNTLLWYLLGGLVLTALFLYLFLTRSILSPLRLTAEHMVDTGELIEDRRFDQLHNKLLPEKRKDEIGRLNHSFNTLINKVQDNESRLARLNLELEDIVAERTADLQQALKELKSSQVQLIRSEKMATLGQMVAGVAHEVNTPLTYVQNNLEIIEQLSEQYDELTLMVNNLKDAMLDSSTSEEEIEELLGDVMANSDDIINDGLSDELKELIKDSLYGVEQITDMVLNLRNFARLDESKVKKTDLRDCIQSSIKIARNTIKQHAVRTNLKEVPEISCSPSQINQVIINLLNNAAQAIGDDPKGEIQLRTLSDKEHVFIDIKDNGCGMTKDVMDKMFEPFFTTKGAGEGTGLGMAICQQIMEQHGGEIRVKSSPGVGSIFRLIFPINGRISGSVFN